MRPILCIVVLYRAAVLLSIGFRPFGCCKQIFVVFPKGGLKRQCLFVVHREQRMLGVRLDRGWRQLDFFEQIRVISLCKPSEMSVSA